MPFWPERNGLLSVTSDENNNIPLGSYFVLDRFNGLLVVLSSKLNIGIPDEKVGSRCSLDIDITQTEKKEGR